MQGANAAAAAVVK
jgi:hypothetical protein